MTDNARNEVDSYMEQISEIFKKHAPFKGRPSEMEEENGAADEKDAQGAAADADDVNAPSIDDIDDPLALDDADIDALFPTDETEIDEPAIPLKPEGEVDVDPIAAEPTAEEGDAEEPSAQAQEDAREIADTEKADAVAPEPDPVAGDITAEQGIAAEPSAEAQMEALAVAGGADAGDAGADEHASADDVDADAHENEPSRKISRRVRIYSEARPAKSANIEAAETDEITEVAEVAADSAIEEGDVNERPHYQMRLRTNDDNELSYSKDTEEPLGKADIDAKEQELAKQFIDAAVETDPDARLLEQKKGDDAEIDPLPFAEEVADAKHSSVGPDDQAYTWAKVPAIYDAKGEEICLGDEMAYLNEYSSIGPVIGIGKDCFFTLSLSVDTRRNKRDSYGESEKVQWMLKDDNGQDRNVFFHYQPDTLDKIYELAQDRDYDIQELEERFRLWVRKVRKEHRDA